MGQGHFFTSLTSLPSGLRASSGLARFTNELWRRLGLGSFSFRAKPSFASSSQARAELTRPSFLSTPMHRLPRKCMVVLVGDEHHPMLPPPLSSIHHHHARGEGEEQRRAAVAVDAARCLHCQCHSEHGPPCPEALLLPRRRPK